ncbi:MAG: TIGR00341 family protein [Prevotella sp.]|nr:TIGR00341 family protein [Bacteroides sp.]MCM1365777.1 TIGR00341 family protein [Prevotella sp.]MCM1436531.1 TIGR00341 family protein [Prevotella sp.]
MYLTNKLKNLTEYFNLTSDLLPQTDAENEIRSGVSFRGSQLVVLILAIFVASLGLNVDSIPVIIGAMLISPLMGPIIGMGLAIGIQDFNLMKRSLKNIAMAVIGSIIASMLYFLISPQYEDSSQLLARTSPTIYDAFIALFGGGAGIISIMCKNKGQVMPGVAIATSLMPPLCTAGYGLATLQMHFFFGALYLFMTNMIFIFVAAWIGVKLARFKKVVYQNQDRAKRVKNIAYIVIILMIGVSVYLTFQMIRKNIFITKATEFVENQMQFPNTQILNHSEYISKGKRYIDVTLIGAPLPKDSLQLAMMNKLDSVGLGGTILNIKQGFSLAATVKSDKDNFNQFYSIMQNEISNRDKTIDSLKNVIDLNNTFSDQSAKISPEIRVIFPSIRDIALSKMEASSISQNPDELVKDTINMVFVNAPQGLTSVQRKKLSEYVGVRLNQKNIHVTVNPANFPWPSSVAEKSLRNQKK